MHHSFINQIENAFLRSSVYHMVGAMFRGHGLVASIVIGVLILAVVYAAKRFAPRFAR